MNATELSQIVVDPDDKTPSLIIKLAAEAESNDPLWPSIKVRIGQILHPFGVHTWVRWRHYDAASGKVIDMNGVICQFCSKARLR